MEIIEYQITRPNGTVLLSVLVPGDQWYSWGDDVADIRGPILTRWRVLPSGPWTVTAYYPDGLGSAPETGEPTFLP